jgi:Uma2 family endonuclease
VSTVAGVPSNLTWDEFLALPHELRNVALIDGEVVVNPPNAQHELVVQNLILAFRRWTEEQSGRGEVSTQQPVKINDRRGYQPDVAWYPSAVCAPPGEPASFSGPPGIVIEVQSPSTRAFDLIRKRADYDLIGIAEAWFVDPRLDHGPGVIVCERPEPGSRYHDRELGPSDTLTSRLLPGFAIPVAELTRR